MKKFNIKLTISLVSFFISLMLLIFSGGNRVCIGIACWLLALALVFFTLSRRENTNELLKNLDEEIELSSQDDADDSIDLEGERHKLVKNIKRTTFTMYFCATLLVIVGIFAFI